VRKRVTMFDADRIRNLSPGGASCTERAPEPRTEGGTEEKTPRVRAASGPGAVSCANAMKPREWIAGRILRLYDFCMSIPMGKRQ